MTFFRPLSSRFIVIFHSWLRRFALGLRSCCYLQLDEYCLEILSVALLLCPLDCCVLILCITVIFSTPCCFGDWWIRWSSIFLVSLSSTARSFLLCHCRLEVYALSVTVKDLHVAEGRYCNVCKASIQSSGMGSSPHLPWKTMVMLSTWHPCKTSSIQVMFLSVYLVWVPTECWTSVLGEMATYRGATDMLCRRARFVRPMIEACGYGE